MPDLRVFESLCSAVGRVSGGAFLACLLTLSASAQADNNAPVIVRPGAPGQASQTLPSTTRATLPPISRTEVGFMQGMIHHHAQAVEMVALMEARTKNKPLLLLGAKIGHSQADEMQFMKRWLATRGESTEMKMDMPATSSDPHAAHSHDAHAGHQMTMLMPGMLTPAQMRALAAAKGAEFDRLFLAGMIQHHEGALTMVKEMTDASGPAQDAELYNFATDVDTGQRAEIKIMQNMLAGKTAK